MISEKPVITKKIKERLYPVVLRQFSMKDFHAVNVRDISKESGISTGTIYKYFPSKEDLCPKIQYRLNGKTVKLDKINGKSGKLEIIISLKNQTSVLKEFTYKEIGTGKTKVATEKIPVLFIVMVSTDLDIEQFNNVMAPEGAFVVVGRTMKMNWISFPYPEAAVKLSADIQKARIPSILFSVIPKFPPLPEMDIQRELLCWQPRAARFHQKSWLSPKISQDWFNRYTVYYQRDSNTFPSVMTSASFVPSYSSRIFASR